MVRDTSCLCSHPHLLSDLPLTYNPYSKSKAVLHYLPLHILCTVCIRNLNKKVNNFQMKIPVNELCIRETVKLDEPGRRCTVLRMQYRWSGGGGALFLIKCNILDRPLGSGPPCSSNLAYYQSQLPNIYFPTGTQGLRT